MWPSRTTAARPTPLTTAKGHECQVQSPSALEAHHLAGGSVTDVVRAMIAARQAGIDLTWANATARDLAGEDVLGAVQASAKPNVVE